MLRKLLKRRFQKNAVFLDHASGTPLDFEIFSTMKPYFSDIFFNPSALYTGGVRVRNILEDARKNIATLINARPIEIVFADGGTEANNMAIFGTVSAWKENHPHDVPHIITTMIEHSSVLETCTYLESHGCEVTYLSVDEQGVVDIKQLKESFCSRTILVSIGYVNGETGVIQNIKEIAKTIRHYRKHQNSEYPYFHTDAVQATNYLPITVPQLGVDMMTINASKIYGPKKIAVLFKKTGIKCTPVLFGGDQEMRLRPGTENIPYIIGMEQSLEKTLQIQNSEYERLHMLQNFFIQEIKARFPGVVINSGEAHRIPNIVNISIPHLSSEEIVLRLDAKGIMASVKSACKSGEDGDSHVILAMRSDSKENTGSIRFSMGRITTKRDIQHTLDVLQDIVEKMNTIYSEYVLA